MVDISKKSKSEVTEEEMENAVSGVKKTDPVQEKKPEKVEVEKTVLDSILKRLDENDAELKILRGASDKKRLEKLDALRNQGKLIKTVKLHQIEGKTVLSWRTVKNDVHFDTKGNEVSEQTAEYFFEDGTSLILQQLEFARTKKTVPAEVIQESKDRDGNVIFKVQLADGREFDVNIVYIN